MVSMYVCGPTVYDYPHIGHGRFVLVFDILRRYLISQGYQVRYVSNITDVDDKILAKADAEGVAPAEITNRYEEIWWETMDKLRVLRPDSTPHATQYVEKMATFVAKLIEEDVAYQLNDGIYFDVSTVSDYGLLARQSLESLRAGARVDEDRGKRSPADFALWKFFPNSTNSYVTPLGIGRPGWHTECVVMARDILGECFDIHGGGLDLAFPHHENERAQAIADGAPFANYWIHNGFIVVGDEKMSKSLGNFVTLPELIGDGDPRSYRLLVLQSHYRSPLEVTKNTIGDATSALGRLDNFSRRYFDAIATSPELAADFETSSGAILDAFVEAMDNDLDTPKVMALLFSAIASANGGFDRGDLTSAIAEGSQIIRIIKALALDIEEDEAAIPPDVMEIFHMRLAARDSKDFATSDRLRYELASRGYVVEDKKGISTIRRS